MTNKTAPDFKQQISLILQQSSLGSINEYNEEELEQFIYDALTDAYKAGYEAGMDELNDYIDKCALLGAFIKSRKPKVKDEP